ncbi:MAG: phospholipase/carboxylesterase [Cellvibrionaceae bacterium]|jgi:phospholipase/carboxylesterase
MSLSNSAQTIEVNHGEGEPSHAVIWLHGLGASSDDFPPVVPYLGLDKAHAIRFIFPQAPNRPITVNGGAVMPGWYDIKGVSIADKEDLVGMTESKNTLDSLIDQQMALGIASERIIVAGFSQGGAVAYYTGIRSPYKLGGILALSTYLPFATEAKIQQSGANTQSPILAMHGLHDAVVPLALGKGSADALSALGYSVEWKTYSMEHNVMPEQLVDIGRWINRIL